MGIIREALDNLVVSESCKGGKCKKHLKEWVTPPCSFNWKELKSLADVEAWAKEVEEKTGKTPKWVISNVNFGDEGTRQRYFDHYTDGDRVFIGGTSGLYGADSDYYLGTAEKDKDGKLQLVFAFDVDDRPIHTALVDKEQFKDQEAIKEGYFGQDNSDELWEAIQQMVFDELDSFGVELEDEDIELVYEITDDVYGEVMDSIPGIVRDMVEYKLEYFKTDFSDQDSVGLDDGDDIGPWGRK